MSGIVRPLLAFEEQYTQVRNEWLRDERISRRARGLFAELWSHRPGWVISVSSLVDSGTEGRDAIRATLNELARFGYLLRVPARDSGRFAGADWRLADPFAEGSPAPENPGAPAPENPAPENPTPKKTTLKKNNPLPPSGVAPPEPKKPRRKPTSALPTDWAPNDSHRAQAEEAHVDVGAEAAKFRDHAEANDRRQVSWDAAFRMWLRRAGEWAASRPGGDRPPGEDAVPADAWMYLGSGAPRKTYADFAEPGAAGV